MCSNWPVQHKVPTVTLFKMSLPSSSLSAIALALAATVCAPASAATLFADSFQGNLIQWGSVGSAVIVADPLVSGGKALAFNVATGGGDIFAAQSYLSTTGNSFTLSYDSLGVGNGGGYVGLNNANGETWLAGDGYHATPVHNPDS